MAAFAYPASVALTSGERLSPRHLQERCPRPYAQTDPLHALEQHPAQPRPLTAAPEATQQTPHWQRPKLQSVSLPQGMSAVNPDWAQKNVPLKRLPPPVQQPAMQPATLCTGQRWPAGTHVGSGQVALQHRVVPPPGTDCVPHVVPLAAVG